MQSRHGLRQEGGVTGMEKNVQLCSPEIIISDDKMSAKMKLRLDSNGSEWTVDELKSLLASKNVKAGIMESAISDVLQNAIYDIFIEVAQGKPSVPGKDGYYIYHVAQAKVEDTPRETGRWFCGVCAYDSPYGGGKRRFVGRVCEGYQW